MSLTIQRVAKCPKQLNVVYCNVYQTKTLHHFHGFRENSTEYQPNSLTKLLPMSFKTSFEWASSYILNSNFHFREIDLCLKWTEVSIQTEKPSKHITSRFTFENSSSILQQLLFWVYTSVAQVHNCFAYHMQTKPPKPLPLPAIICLKSILINFPTPFRIAKHIENWMAKSDNFAASIEWKRAYGSEPMCLVCFIVYSASWCYSLLVHFRAWLWLFGSICSRLAVANQTYNQLLQNVSVFVCPKDHTKLKLFICRPCLCS